MKDTKWTASDYHPLTHNCNCFCKQLGKLLGVSVPYWINRASQWAALFAPSVLWAVGWPSGTVNRLGAGLQPHPAPVEVCQCGAVSSSLTFCWQLTFAIPHC